MKKSIVITSLIAISMVLGLTGCAKKDNSKIHIGVIQLVEHPALDASRKGFVDGLKDAGYVDGENIVIDYQNAQNEQANCATIAQKFVNDRDDLIFADRKSTRLNSSH